MISFAWRARPTILVAVHNEASPSQAEWNEYLALVAEIRETSGTFADVRGLAVTDGGGPAHMQRAQLNRLLGGESVPAAVVTNSKLVRAIVHVLGLFNPLAKEFTPTQLPAALDYLGLSVEQHHELIAAISEARAELGIVTQKKSA